jgi:hypothetical protein
MRCLYRISVYLLFLDVIHTALAPIFFVAVTTNSTLVRVKEMPF